MTLARPHSSDGCSLFFINLPNRTDFPCLLRTSYAKRNQFASLQAHSSNWRTQETLWEPAPLWDVMSASKGFRGTWEASWTLWGGRSVFSVCGEVLRMASAIPSLEGVPQLEEEATSLLLGLPVRRNVYE